MVPGLGGERTREKQRRGRCEPGRMDGIVEQLPVRATIGTAEQGAPIEDLGFLPLALCQAAAYPTEKPLLSTADQRAGRHKIARSTSPARHLAAPERGNVASADRCPPHADQEIDDLGCVSESSDPGWRQSQDGEKVQRPARPVEVSEDEADGRGRTSGLFSGVSRVRNVLRHSFSSVVPLLLLGGEPSYAHAVTKLILVGICGCNPFGLCRGERVVPGL
ncbi:hypothetical protein SAMN04489729_2629 [Amycolatopsis lurida]|nr:hypothetical protein SAMN04489729_2629 [Amycolatopsis lurida]